MQISHFLLMVHYAVLVAIFFALLWKRTGKARLRLFLQLFVGLVGGGLALAWLMYFFPSGPPTPFP